MIIGELQVAGNVATREAVVWNGYVVSDGEVGRLGVDGAMEWMTEIALVPCYTELLL
jgi:hypothetical protein